VSILKTNLVTWFQDEGQPLLSGYIYVGNTYQDPRTFPKTVTFQDSSGNQFTAAQPLRTDVNGRIQYNGKAIIATVEGDYSLRIENSSEQLIENGYIPFVSADTSSGSSGLESYRQYGLTLSAIKSIDVTPGQTVGNVGKLSVDDGQGADWLAIINTGGTPDDVDLIDFNNGVQGQRILNYQFPSTTRQIFTSSGTWTRPDGCRSIKVECVGAGGSSGTAAGTSSTSNFGLSGSGGGGAYASSIIDVSSISSSPVTVGVGSVGSEGGDTSFGVLVVADGGKVGSDGINLLTANSQIILGGLGGEGSSSTGEIVVSGGKGSHSTYIVSSGSDVGLTGGNSISPSGSDSFGNGGAGSLIPINIAASDQNPGIDGICIVTEYY